MRAKPNQHLRKQRLKRMKMTVILMRKRLSKNRREPLRCGMMKKMSSRKEHHRLKRKVKMRYPLMKHLKRLLKRQLKKLMQKLTQKWTLILSIQIFQKCVREESKPSIHNLLLSKPKKLKLFKLPRVSSMKRLS
jgi:hypothetical protein